MIDRGISVGRASIAIYFSAEQAVYEAMLPVFTTVTEGVSVTRG